MLLLCLVACLACLSNYLPACCVAPASAAAAAAGLGEDGGLVGVFSGLVTSANNGGFASVRSRNLSPPLDLKGEPSQAALSHVQHGQSAACNSLDVPCPAEPSLSTPRCAVP